jgi:hypothetical protein
MKNYWLIGTFLFLSFSAFGVSANLPANAIFVDGKELESIAQVRANLKDGSQIYLGPGVYTQGLVIDKNNVTLTGSGKSEGGTHFKAAVVEKKGTIVVKGDDVVIESIQCSDVNVRDQNGACIRQEGQNLSVTNVFFHNSQQGILTSYGTGFLKIKFSEFKGLGLRGQAHSIYSNGQLLEVFYTTILDTKSQGHAIKSRSKITRIKNSTISSGLGDDSRLLDISNGGIVEISDSVLHQGINTVNGQLIGFALEDIGRAREHALKIENTLIIAERERGNTLLLKPKSLPKFGLSLVGNVLVGEFKDAKLLERESQATYFFSSRSDAKIKPNTLPDFNYVNLVKNGIIK